MGRLESPHMFVEVTLERLRRALELDEAADSWLAKRRPFLVQLGCLKRVGRKHFGDPVEVVAALPAADRLYREALAARRTRRRSIRRPVGARSS